MKIPDYFVVACWLVFGVYWLLGSLRAKAIAEKQSRGAAMQHRLALGLGCFLLIFRKFPAPLNAALTPHTGVWQAAGAVVCLVGLAATLWARRTLAGNWSSDVTFKHGHELIKTGPYRFARHPIYTGLLVMFLGTAVQMCAMRAWLALPVITAGFWIKLRQEERLLLRHFPATYPAYQKSVKALIPFVL
jgi:protein-S-isoprenylcysteine O-methyltransferase Ste14